MILMKKKIMSNFFKTQLLGLFYYYYFPSLFYQEFIRL